MVFCEQWNDLVFHQPVALPCEMVAFVPYLGHVVMRLAVPRPTTNMGWYFVSVPPLGWVGQEQSIRD